MRSSFKLEYIKYMKEAPIKFLIHSVDSTSSHWHYEYELFFVLCGSVRVNTNGKEYILNSGDIILFNSGDIHSTSSDDKNNICLFLQFHPELLSEDNDDLIFQFRLNMGMDTLVDKEVINTIRVHLAEMGLLFQEKPRGYQFNVKSKLYALIGILMTDIPFSVNQPIDNIKRNEQLQDFDLIKEYIRNNFKEDIHQQKICKDLGMSRSKIFRTLKTSGSMSITSLINYYRVEYAKNLLRNTTYSISYISDNCGFQSDTSFYRTFKSFAKVAPKQYRHNPNEQGREIGPKGYSDFSLHDSINILRKHCK